MNKVEVVQSLFDFSEHIRYVAIYDGHELEYQQRRANLSGASSSDTDKYEELLVNPTLLKLASQRGNIDCGGLRHLVVGYGNFNQLVFPTGDGHLSVCVELKADLDVLPETIIKHFKDVSS